MVDYKALMDKPPMTEEERDELWRPFREAHKDEIAVLDRRCGDVEGFVCTAGPIRLANGCNIEDPPRARCLQCNWFRKPDK
jgi:hypothetical protein